MYGQYNHVYHDGVALTGQCLVAAAQHLAQYGLHQSKYIIS